MAKEIKVFNGDVSGANQIIYTVPAGRVAKIIIGAIISSSGTQGSINLVVGSCLIYTFSAPANNNIVARTSSAGLLTSTTNVTGASSPGDGQKFMSVIQSGGSAFSIASAIDSEMYLAAGQTVVFNAGATTDYNFTAIEEF